MPLNDTSLVYFGNDWFAENRTSSHHIARLLSKGCRVLYVETPGMRGPHATQRDFKKLCQKLKRSFLPPQQIHENLWILTVPQIPLRRLPFTHRLNHLYSRKVIRGAIRRLGFERIMLWFAVPHPGSLAGCLGEDFVTYYCTDNYSFLTGVDGREIALLDEKLTHSADQLFVTSTALLEEKKRLNASTTYSPHGVDFSHFSSMYDSLAPVAPLARGLRHPVIGFFGSIGAWLDLDLLEFLARSRPEWTLLLIGLPSIDVRQITKYRNVVMAGPQPYETLPQWARAFDVAVIPYLQANEGVIHANPLKLREYLATGKPVVAVPNHETERFAHCIGLARTPQQFLRKIEEALAQDSETKRQLRMRQVAGLSWQSRVDEIVRVVEGTLSKKMEQRQAASWHRDTENLAALQTIRSNEPSTVLHDRR